MIYYYFFFSPLFIEKLSGVKCEFSHPDTFNAHIIKTQIITSFIFKADDLVTRLIYRNNLNFVDELIEIVRKSNFFQLNKLKKIIDQKETSS